MERVGAPGLIRQVGGDSARSADPGRRHLAPPDEEAQTTCPLWRFGRHHHDGVLRLPLYGASRVDPNTHFSARCVSPRGHTPPFPNETTSTGSWAWVANVYMERWERSTARWRWSSGPVAASARASRLKRRSP